MCAERRDEEYLQDIREAIGRIRDYVAPLTYELFLRDTKTQDAVIRNLQVRGEAAKRIPPASKEGLGVPWREMAGIRDKIVHDYFGISLEVIWDVAALELPEMLKKLPPERG